MSKTALVRIFLILVLVLAGMSSLLVAGYLLAQNEFAPQNKVIVYDGNDQIAAVSGNFQAVADVLQAAGVTLRPEDVVRPSLDSPISSHTPINIQRAHAVTVRSVQGTQTNFTQQLTIGAFLAEIALVIPPETPVFVDGRKVAQADLATRPLPATLEIGQFTTITITDGRQRQTIRTAVATVGAALQEAGLTLTAQDSVAPAANSPLTPGLNIQIRRAFEVTILVDGRIITARTNHTSALDVLAENGVSLIGNDYANPGPERPLQPHDTIQVIRVTEDFRTQDIPIPFQTVFQASDLLEIDTQAVVVPGIPGINRQRVRVRYENSVPAGETIDASWVAREPVSEVVGYGTKIVVRTIDTPDGPLPYWRVVKMRVTSYTAASSGKELDAPDYGITASGYQAAKGIVAIDRTIVPWKSWVYVPGYGRGYAGDTGGGVLGRWIDLGYEEEGYVPWSGYVDVYYLAPVPPPAEINYLLPEALP